MIIFPHLTLKLDKVLNSLTMTNNPTPSIQTDFLSIEGGIV